MKQAKTFFKIALVLCASSLLSRQLFAIFTGDILAYTLELVVFRGKKESIKLMGDAGKGSRAFVKLVQDAAGNKFVLKQFKIHDLDNEFGVIREALAARVAESANIPMNRVTIVPANKNFPGKIFKQRVATLHTFVAGTLLKDTELPYRVKLRLRWQPHLSPDKRGLKKLIITSMSFHKDLPVIVAFDVFVCCASRHRKNLIYNKQTDRFCGIDLEQAGRKPFDTNFSELTYYNMKELFKNPELNLNNQEIVALKLFHKTLKKLIAKNPPEKLHALIDELVDQAGLMKKGYFSAGQMETDLASYIYQYKIRITQHYQIAQKLSAYLDSVL